MEKQSKEQLTFDQILDCKHELTDEYSDGARECVFCGEELGPAGLMLKHLVTVVEVTGE